MDKKLQYLLAGIVVMALLWVLNEYMDAKRQQEEIQSQVFSMINGHQARMEERSKSIRDRISSFDAAFDNKKKNLESV